MESNRLSSTCLILIVAALVASYCSPAIDCKRSAANKPAVVLYPQRPLEECLADAEALNKWLLKHKLDTDGLVNANNSLADFERAIKKLDRIGRTDGKLERAILVLKELAETSECTGRTWSLLDHVNTTIKWARYWNVDDRILLAVHAAEEQAARVCEPALRDEFVSTYGRFVGENQKQQRAAGGAANPVENLQRALVLASGIKPADLELKTLDELVGPKSSGNGLRANEKTMSNELAGLSWGYILNTWARLRPVIYATFRQDSEYTGMQAKRSYDANSLQRLYNKYLVDPCRVIERDLGDIYRRSRLLMLAQALDTYDRLEYWSRQPDKLRHQMFVVAACRDLPPFERVWVDYPKIFES